MSRSMVAVVIVMGSLLFAAPGRGDGPPPSRFAGIRVGAFGDIVLGHPSKGGGVQYEAGEIDLYASKDFTNDWSMLGEVLVQHVGNATDIDVRQQDQFDTNLERLYVAYNPSDRLRVEIGQIHTGIVQWNEREHRSRFLQTPIDVPSMANREVQGGAWPLHFSGAWASGRVPGSLGAAYGVGLGAARGSERDDIQPLIRHGVSPAGLFMVSVAPDAITGLEAGAAGYVGRIRAPGQTMQELDATLFSSFVRGGLELRGEWARMAHSPISDTAEYVTRGWYLLASVRPRGRWKPLRPYVLLDHLHVPAGEKYLADVQNQNAWAAGVRWDVSPRLAIKSDVRRQLLSANRASTFRLELALSF